MISNEDELLDIQKCFIILDIDITKINIDKELIKKKYHKMALKWHPDKNKNMDQDYVKERFQQINNAYIYLCEEMDLNNTIDNNFVSYDPKIYVELLKLFFLNITKGKYKDYLVELIGEIVTNSKEYLYKYLITRFETLDKESILELYRLLNTYKDILYINNDILDFVSLQIKEKYKNDQIFILNPSISDILNNNIYKLYIENKLYLVPLWHTELYFDNPNDNNNDIIVLCQPNIPENIIIDEYNNINYELYINFNKLDLLEKKNITFEIGDKYFNIPIEKLHIKREQYYILKSQGISKLVENDMYNIINKADIIVKLIFT
jgi:hypothetical protein